MQESWQNEMRQRITGLPDHEHSALIAELIQKNALPFAATAYWLSLADEDYRTCERDARGVPRDPILAQALPSPEELEISALESLDPLNETRHSPYPRIVHQYPSRVLLRTTGECALFCRHCFRRSLLPQERGFISESAEHRLIDYLKAHQEVREVLISGGDPLTASDARLAKLFSGIREAGANILIRLCTRMPVTLPSRVTREFVDMLKRFKPLQVVLHINHPRELSDVFVEKARLFMETGLPVHSQTVLLRGINDNLETLVSLFSRLTRIGIDPYYLFQGDLAAGTRHFRVPLSKGLALYAELRKQLSGLELPRYAVDAPDGAGKLYLPESVVGREGDFWILRAPDGSLHQYPEETD